MRAQFLLDTNVISEPLRAQPIPQVLTQIQLNQGQIAIASITWHELWLGCYRLPPSKKRTAIETYLNELIDPTIPVLPYDDSAAEWHAAERARLTKKGRTPTFADGQIAAIAYSNKLTLITRNRSDFSEFQDIQVIDWAEP